MCVGTLDVHLNGKKYIQWKTYRSRRKIFCLLCSMPTWCLGWIFEWKETQQKNENLFGGLIQKQSNNRTLKNLFKYSHICTFLSHHSWLTLKLVLIHNISKLMPNGLFCKCQTNQEILFNFCSFLKKLELSISSRK